MKKTLQLLTVCLILALSFSACKYKEESETEPVAVATDSEDISADPEQPSEKKVSENETLPDEKEEADPIDEAEEAAVDDGFVPVAELPIDETDGIIETVTMILERSTALDFSSAMELAAPDSGALGYLSRISSLDPELLLGSSAYAQIKALANLVDVDITTSENTERLTAFIQRLAPYLSYSIGAITSDGASARAEVAVIAPDIKVAAIFPVINSYLTSVGTDLSTVRAAAELMDAEERSAYMEELAWNVADYALSGGLDLSKTAETEIILTLTNSGGRWLVTDIDQK